VESVAWVAERKDVLGALFCILSMGAYARYAQRSIEVGNPERGDIGGFISGSGSGWYLSSIGLFLLSLLSKPMAVTLPFVLLLLDYWPLRRWSSFRVRLVVEKVPYFVCAMAISVITFIAQRSAGALANHASVAERLANAVVSYCRYLAKICWPVDLAVFYPPVTGWSATILLGSIIGLIGITGLVIWQRGRSPCLAVGWFWFIGTLFPVIGVVQAGEQSMADRYSYVPCVGFFIAVIGALGALVDRHRPITPLVALMALAGLVACGWLTRQQLRYWVSSETLFRHAIAVTSGNYLAHQNLATALDKAGRTDEAEREFERALKIRPEYPLALINLGSLLAKQKRWEEAIRTYRRAIQINPGYAEAHNHLGVALESQGVLAEAVKEYGTALILNPAYADAHYNRGLALARSGHLTEAILDFEETLKLEPGSADACNNLGTTLQGLGRVDESLHYFRLATELRPDFARAHYNLGVGLAAKGRLDEAVTEFKRALQIQPNYPEALKNLDAILNLRSNGLDNLR